jgi:hypothetical protein
MNGNRGNNITRATCENEKQSVIDWNFSVKAAANQGTDGTDIDGKNADENCDVLKEKPSWWAARREQHTEAREEKLGGEDAINLFDEAKSGAWLLKSLLLFIWILLHFSVSVGHSFDIFLDFWK